jgi:hypothetical protein
MAISSQVEGSKKICLKFILICVLSGFNVIQYGVEYGPDINSWGKIAGWWILEIRYILRDVSCIDHKEEMIKIPVCHSK